MDAMARADASRAITATESTAMQLRFIEDRQERLALVCAAMWSLVKQSLPFTDEQLMARIQDLDLSDGKLDGKIRPDAQDCPGCKRKISARFLQCLYCGHELPRCGPFDLRS